MNILLANNYFYIRGGAEKVFFDEAKLLESNGHNIYYFATLDEKNFPTPFSKYFVSGLEYRLKNIGRFIYCKESRTKIRAMIHECTPEIAHMHNIYQDISPSILPVLKKNNIPIIVTLHDYKLICPNYTMLSGDAVCEDCKKGRYYKCVQNRCKQGSVSYSAVFTLEAYVHSLLNIWAGNVTKFISPSRFLRNKMVEFGWRENSIEYIPNFLDVSNLEPRFDSEHYFVCISRLSKEKGIGTLIEAFMKIKNSAVSLVIVGEGPVSDELKLQSYNDKRIVFTGYLSGKSLMDAARNAKCLVIPSQWYENAPISILEALAYGKPIVGSRIGGIPEMIDDGVNGFLFEPGNVEDLRDRLELVMRLSDSKISEMGNAAREKVEREYNAKLHYERLTQVYNNATHNAKVTLSDADN